MYTRRIIYFSAEKEMFEKVRVNKKIGINFKKFNKSFI